MSATPPSNLRSAFLAGNSMQSAAIFLTTVSSTPPGESSCDQVGGRMVTNKDLYRSFLFFSYDEGDIDEIDLALILLSLEKCNKHDNSLPPQTIPARRICLEAVNGKQRRYGFFKCHLEELCWAFLRPWSHPAEKGGAEQDPCPDHNELFFVSRSSMMMQDPSIAVAKSLPTEKRPGKLPQSESLNSTSSVPRASAHEIYTRNRSLAVTTTGTSSSQLQTRNFKSPIYKLAGIFLPNKEMPTNEKARLHLTNPLDVKTGT